MPPRPADGPTAPRPSGRQPRALFGNAAFQAVAGSELVILEAAENLISRGWACDVTAWHSGGRMAALAAKAGLRVLPDPRQVRAFDYDLVWMQNRLETVLNRAPGADEAPRTLFAFAHLDRDWSFAQPGVVFEPLVGQLFVVTSERAVDRVVAGGLAREHVRMFRNAAPAAFEMPPTAPKAHLERLLVVSNHPPPELVQAVDLLRARGVDVAWWGRGGDVVGQRLSPEALGTADAVVSIGKTASYAIRARRPLYVYDHFGGPGWLSAGNVRATRERNFTGLCCARRLSSAALAEEIEHGFAAAAVDDLALSLDERADFALETFMDEVVALVEAAPSPADHRARMAPVAAALEAERRLALTAGAYYASIMRGRRAKAARKKAAAASLSPP